MIKESTVMSLVGDKGKYVRSLVGDKGKYGKESCR